VIAADAFVIGQAAQRNGDNTSAMISIQDDGKDFTGY
jgi:hypothetical protein